MMKLIVDSFDNNNNNNTYCNSEHWGLKSVLGKSHLVNWRIRQERQRTLAYVKPYEKNGSKVAGQSRDRLSNNVFLTFQAIKKFFEKSSSAVTRKWLEGTRPTADSQTTFFRGFKQFGEILKKVTERSRDSGWRSRDRRPTVKQHFFDVSSNWTFFLKKIRLTQQCHLSIEQIGLDCEVELHAIHGFHIEHEADEMWRWHCEARDRDDIGTLVEMNTINSINSIQFNSIQLNSTQLNSTQLNSTQLNSIQFSSIQKIIFISLHASSNVHHGRAGTVLYWLRTSQEEYDFGTSFNSTLNLSIVYLFAFQLTGARWRHRVGGRSVTGTPNVSTPPSHIGASARMVSMETEKYASVGYCAYLIDLLHSMHTKTRH